MNKLMSNKKFTRITALLLAVAVIFGTMFALPVSAASGDKVTITFDYCYDSAGNIIRYKQTTVSDGYTVGTPGEELCKIFADGKEAYCIEPGHTLYSGNTLTESASTVWKNLGSAKQKAINLALLYGKPGSGKSLSGTEDQKWVATQLIVWEFVSGCRSTADGYKCTNTKFIDGICAGGANPGVKSVYNAISKSLSNYSTVPSFASAIASKAETYEMKYSDGKYTLTLTDSNNILSDFSFKTTSGISVSKSGNKLTLTSSSPVNDAVTFNSAKSMPSVSGTTLVPYGDASLQDVITGVENDADPIRAYFKVKTNAGNLKLKKTSEDGVVKGIKFKVTGTDYNKTATTDENGTFTLTDLVPGNYTVTEITDSKYETQKSQTVKVESGKTATVTFENVLKKGSLEVVKTSEDNFNEGVKFHLYGTSLSGASVDLYATTNADGVATFKDVLVSGDKPYTLEEVDTADRYVVPKAQTAPIEWNKVTQRSFENLLKKWNLTVTKTDAETKSAQGDATLAGAVYGIYNDGKLIDKYTTDKNGSFATSYYVCGDNWTLKEIDPSEGYLLDETEYHIGAEEKKYTVENNSISMDVTEDILKGKIAIIKHTDDGSTKIETPEKGAEFQLYLKSSGSYAKAKETERDTLVCDEYGFAETKNLPYGTYTVHQTKGWNGTEFIADFDVFVNEDGKTYKYLINNASLESYVKIVKVDSETGKQIPYAGAGFQIYDPNGKLVTMTYTYPEVTTIDTFYTNSEGYLITPETLPYDKGYSVVEVQAPYGYILDSTPVYFDITAENTTEENGVTIVKTEKKNTPQKGTITVEKTGEIFSNVTLSGEEVIIYQPEYSANGLSGAVFEIYADENITTPDGTVITKKDELVATLKTNTKGTATSKQLYLGKYRVVEKTAPDGFVLNRTVNHIELTYAGQNEKVTNTATSFTNDRQKVEIDLTKILEQDEKFNIGNNDEIRNVSFGLYADEDLKAANGTVIPKNGLLEIISCDEKGKVNFTTDLPIGSYYVKEISTDNHYILSDKKYPVVFEYAGQDTATVHISVNDGESIENEIIYGTIKGLKIDRETGENIAGALFGLFSTDETEFKEETAILTAESNDEGVFEFTDVPYGEYIVRELKPVEGYLPNEENYQATVSEDEEVIEITVENDKIPKLGTTATINGKKEVGATEVFTLEDVVEYKHLVPGKEYTVKGVLMDKATGEPLLIDEKEIRSENTFTPDEPTGEVIVSFEFDARYIKEETNIVVFESLYSKDKELAVHADLEDEGQTVTVKIPKIGTKASIDGKKEFTANGDITIDDVVSYKNLTVGKEYTISGVLMDKATGKNLIEKILKDFPDSKDMFEYADYLEKQNQGSASDFISRVMEDYAYEISGRKAYADYIATRPRAERFGSHGLFTDDGVQVQLSKVSEELDRHKGNIWTAIISIRREDAERLGFNTGARWRDMLRTQTESLAKNLKIPMENLRWYAAFHNESHHPHVHLIAYSTVENEGYLTQKGVENLRSSFAKDIFQQDLLCIYERQTEHRDKLRAEARDIVEDLVSKIDSEIYISASIQHKLLELADRLSKSSGKKVYGYLKPDVKAIVDSIVDELANDSRIKKLYDLWYEQKENTIRTYTDEIPDRIPLAQNKEFKSIKNAVIKEALKLNLTEDEAEESENTDEESVPNPFEYEENTSAEPVFDSGIGVLYPHYSIKTNRNSVAVSSLYLLRYLCNMIQSRLRFEEKQKAQRTDKKLQQKINDKKQAQGLKM